MKEIMVFAGNGNPGLAKSICHCLGVTLGSIRVGRFPDGEIDVQIFEHVRGRDVFIVQPTHATGQAAFDNLGELLIMIDAFRRASAGRITAVISYFGYARQDWEKDPHTPITAKLAANLITVAGANRVIGIEFHAKQEQGFFDIPCDLLFAKSLVINEIRQRGLSPLSISSVDSGGVKLAESWAEHLGAERVILDKKRVDGRQVIIRGHTGPIKDRHVCLADDETSTAGSIIAGAEYVMEQGALSVGAALTHAKLVGDAVERLMRSPLGYIYVTDTLPQPPLPDSKFHVLSFAPLLANCIVAIHQDESVSAIM